jgi:hypothetical protein
MSSKCPQLRVGDRLGGGQGTPPGCPPVTFGPPPEDTDEQLLIEGVFVVRLACLMWAEMGLRASAR